MFLPCACGLRFFGARAGPAPVARDLAPQVVACDLHQPKEKKHRCLAKRWRTLHVRQGGSGIEPPTPHLQAVESSNTENVCEHGELSETATSLSGIRPKEVPLATVAGASGCWYSRHVDYSSTKKRYYSTGGKLRI
ncbi:hypothetical protein VTI28DRAFT_6909 [Corynascus sepedonium]